MKILYFELDGYKNIENARIDLSDNTTLMALNAKGKSNLLRGVLFGLSLLSANNVDLRNVIYQNESSLSRSLVHSSINKPFRFGIQAQTQFEEITVDRFSITSFLFCIARISKSGVLMNLRF